MKIGSKCVLCKFSNVISRQLHSFIYGLRFTKLCVSISFFSVLRLHTNLKSVLK